MAQQPDAKPGNYYVTVRRDNGDAVFLAGPFRDNHRAALAMVDQARRVAQDLDPRAAWYGFGTARTAYSYDRPGKLNERLGLSGMEQDAA